MFRVRRAFQTGRARVQMEREFCCAYFFCPNIDEQDLFRVQDKAIDSLSKPDGSLEKLSYFLARYIYSSPQSRGDLLPRSLYTLHWDLTHDKYIA